uniref:Uncharacterized protein n=1 Tax=Rhizophora mucronata TaxID=61149 RepID=A0A2P2K4L6_RHIMU
MKTKRSSLPPKKEKPKGCFIVPPMWQICCVSLDAFVVTLE